MSANNYLLTCFWKIAYFKGALLSRESMWRWNLFLIKSTRIRWIFKFDFLENEAPCEKKSYSSISFAVARYLLINSADFFVQIAPFIREHPV